MLSPSKHENHFFSRLLERFQVFKRLRQSLRCLLAAVDAVSDSYAAVGIARERKAGKFLELVFDASDSCEMADVVLRHGARMTVNAREERLGGHVQ